LKHYKRFKTSVSYKTLVITNYTSYLCKKHSIVYYKDIFLMPKKPSLVYEKNHTMLMQKTK